MEDTIADIGQYVIDLVDSYYSDKEAKIIRGYHERKKSEYPIKRESADAWYKEEKRKIQSKSFCEIINRIQKNKHLRRTEVHVDKQDGTVKNEYINDK